jgi:uncharacterized cofD-like protein
MLFKTPSTDSEHYRLPEALIQTAAPKTYVVNLVTDPSETNGYKASDFIQKIEEYFGMGALIDYAIVNNEPIDPMLCRLYATEHKFPVEPDLEACQKLVSQEVISGNFVKGKTILRHDSNHIAEILLNHHEKKARHSLDASDLSLPQEFITRSLIGSST